MVFSIDMTAKLQGLRVRVLSHEAEEMEVRLYPKTCPPEDRDAYAARKGCGDPDTTAAADANSCFVYEENQKALWIDDTIGGGYYEVGVSAPHLVAQDTWFVRVTAKAAQTFDIETSVGAAACVTPTYDSENLPANMLTRCAKHVQYPTLGVELQAREGVAPVQSPCPGLPRSECPCMDAVLEAWCKQVFYKCDANGVGVRPCPTVCGGIQRHCPGHENEGWEEANKAINDVVCGISLDDADYKAGLHANFGSAQNCFPDFVHIER